VHEDGKTGKHTTATDRWPPIKITATSGRVLVSDDDLPTGSVFLPNPYRAAELVATLRELN
jgi:hypothetical protein